MGYVNNLRKIGEFQGFNDKIGKTFGILGKSC